MRNRMVSANLFPIRFVDFKRCKVFNFNFAFNHAAAMNENRIQLTLGVINFRFEAFAADNAGIADLSAAFAVKRRLVRNQIKFAAFHAVNIFAVLNQNFDNAIALGRLIA